MDVRTCYETMDANYEDALNRFLSEDRIKRFLGMFLRDTSYELLEKSLGEKDYETAFRAAHTLKGVAMNLALTRMAESSSELTEALRGGTPNGDIDGLYAAVSEAYKITRAAIEALE